MATAHYQASVPYEVQKSYMNRDMDCHNIDNHPETGAPYKGYGAPGGLPETIKTVLKGEQRIYGPADTWKLMDVIPQRRQGNRLWKAFTKQSRHFDSINSFLRASSLDECPMLKERFGLNEDCYMNEVVKNSFICHNHQLARDILSYCFIFCRNCGSVMKGQQVDRNCRFRGAGKPNSSGGTFGWLDLLDAVNYEFAERFEEMNIKSSGKNVLYSDRCHERCLLQILWNGMHSLHAKNKAIVPSLMITIDDP